MAITRNTTRLQLFWSLAFACVSATNMAGQSLHIASGTEITNPPTKFAVHNPTAEDFNVIFRKLIGTDLIDIRAKQADPNLVVLLARETSNGFYNRIKVRERDFQGSVLITPSIFQNQQLVTIAARIARKSFLSKTLQSEYLLVIFTDKGKFKEIRKGVGTIQDI